MKLIENMSNYILDINLSVCVCDRSSVGNTWQPSLRVAVQSQGDGEGRIRLE